MTGTNDVHQLTRGRSRHRTTLVEGIRRAWEQRNWRKLAEYGFAAVLLAALIWPVAWGWSAAFATYPTTGMTTAEAAKPVTVRSIDEAEMVYLAELSFGGVKLTRAEQEIAVEIAREHVAHGHLDGMRYRITDDFYYRIPRLTTDERDVARICVEHHFKAVTG
jgi:hypothetical protein